MLPLLNAIDISFSFAEHPVLCNISLTLSPGEVLSLIGPNGSGKTTLIRALLGQLRASGKILWRDQRLSSWRPRDLARLLAYLPQSPAAQIGERVIDVLRLGRAPYWSAFGIESAHDLEVCRQVSQLLGLDDLLMRQMDELSGGQRQRVFVGRCLVQEPSALLLDEPSTFLDLRHQVELLQLLRKLSREQNIGILMASHDLNLAAVMSDRLMVLENGNVVATGKPDEVLNPDLLSHVYGVPMERIGRDGPPLIVPKL